ncbi:hypothetical protein [Salinarimonas chemoclinalis]|uniref:hypothetical protein n=1 Tax=Salinarimonas chemoclinalis TaxID=3241599 RepID=UPI0035587925
MLHGSRTRDREIKVGWHSFPVLPLEPGHAQDGSPRDFVDDMREALSATTCTRLTHIRSKGCYFTNSTDENDVLDWTGPNEFVAGGLSGHGFGFAPALGAGLVEAAASGRIPDHLACFGLSRFDGSVTGGRTHLDSREIVAGRNRRV